MASPLSLTLFGSSPKGGAMMFDLEVDSDLIEQRIYERQALLCRYRYLLARARELGLHTILKKYQPLG